MPSRLWHLTDSSDFALDPDYAPKGGADLLDSSFRHEKGLFLTPNPELWFYLWAMKAYGSSVRAVEIDVSRLTGTELQDLNRYPEDRDQWFVPAKAFGKIKVLRNVPIETAMREGNRQGYGFALIASDVVETRRICVIDHSDGPGSFDARCGRVTTGDPIKWTTTHWLRTGPMASRICEDCMAILNRLPRRTGSSQPGIYYHVTTYRNWPDIRDNGLRPGRDGHVWLFTNAEAAMRFKDAWDSTGWRTGVPPEQWNLPPCIIVVRTDRAVPTEAGIPGAYWVEGGVTKAEVYDVIRPEDMHHYATKRTAANGVWYHASYKVLPVGTALKALDEPRYRWAVPGKVYFTPDPYIAAQHVGGVTRFYNEGVQKAYLYQVEPIGEIEDDPEVAMAGAQFYGAAYMADDAVVTKVLSPGDGLEVVLDLPRQEYLRVASKTAADEDYSDFVMVCLRPSEATRKVYADMDECTEDADDLHITLYYLGTKAEAGGEAGRERLMRGCYDFALHSGYRGLTGVANGFGCFMNDDTNVLISLWDIPGIADFRTYLMDKVREHGYTPRQDNHGFTPHMTLAYDEEKPFLTLPRLPDGNPEEEVFHSLWIAWGEEWTEVTLA